MKNKFLSFLVILTFLFSLNTYAYDVSERVRIGVKYGSSAVTSSAVSSENGFILWAKGVSDKIIAEIPNTSVKVDSYNNNGINSYFVVEQSGFPDFENTLLYCQTNGFATVPYYRNGVFYAAGTFAHAGRNENEPAGDENFHPDHGQYAGAGAL